MAEETASVAGAVEHALEFAREAWREAWAPLALQATGVALFYISFQLGIAFGPAFFLGLFGLVLALASSPSAVGALYRLGLGGARAKEIGPYGLQWGAPEKHLTMVWGMFALLLVVIWFPLSVAAALAFMLFREAGGVELGLFGRVQVSFLIATGIFFLGSIGWAWLLLRLSLSPAATVAEGRVMVFDAWPLTAGRVVKIALAWTVLHLPTVGAWSVALLLTIIESRAAGSATQLPLPEAIGTALVIGAVSGFMQTPLAVGAFSYFHRPRAAEAASPLRFAEGL